MKIQTKQYGNSYFHFFLSESDIPVGWYHMTFFTKKKLHSCLNTNGAWITMWAMQVNL